MVDTSADATSLSPWWRHSAILVMIAGSRECFLFHQAAETSIACRECAGAGHEQQKSSFSSRSQAQLSPAHTVLRTRGMYRSRRNLLPQPCREGGGIEAHRTADPKTGKRTVRGELVDLPFADIQQLRNIGHGERRRPLFERIREVHLNHRQPVAPEQGRRRSGGEK